MKTERSAGEWLPARVILRQASSLSPGAHTAGAQHLRPNPGGGGRRGRGAEAGSASTNFGISESVKTICLLPGGLALLATRASTERHQRPAGTSVVGLQGHRFVALPVRRLTLRDLGVRIAMDDFGTGNSSLGYPRSFPFDKIKIDRSFVRDLGESDDSLAIVRAVAGLGTSLRMTTTAEGVETAEQLRKVREEGCSEVQGNYFSRSCPKEEIAVLLRGQIAAVA